MAAALAAGRSGIGPLNATLGDKLLIKIGAEVPGFDPLAHFEEKRLALLDPCAQFALIAAREAAAASELTSRTDLGVPRAAAIIGAGVGGMTTLDENFHRVYAEGFKRVPPLSIPKLMISAACSHIAIEFGIRGPVFTVASACASANHAMGTAFHMVRSGVVDVALTGGTEAVMTYGTMKGWEAMRILAPDTCRPFSRDRKGLVIGEGAAMLVLENFEQARARGADILGEMVGFGMSADAGDIVQPSVEGRGERHARLSGRQRPCSRRLRLYQCPWHWHDRE